MSLDTKIGPNGTTTDIERRTTITELVNVWRQAEQDLRTGFALVEKAQNALTHFFDGGSRYMFDLDGYSYKPKFDEPDAAIAHLHKQVWAALVARLELRAVMSLARAAEVDKQLETGKDLPPITVENVMAMLESNLNNLGQFLEEKVYEVYEWLRPDRWGTPEHYVTNQKSHAAGVGRKIIIGWAVDSTYRDGRRCFQVRYSSTDRFRALDQVFHMLDGKPQSRQYEGDLCNAILTQTEASSGDAAETEYFRVKCYRNNNLHLEFKRLDLLDQFNVMAGGALLKKAQEVTA